MRKYNKYKILFKVGSSLKNFPIRLLKFKKAKWLTIKKKLGKNVSNKSICNPIVKKDFFKNWFKLENFYYKSLKNNLLLKNYYSKLINIKKLKKKKKSLKLTIDQNNLIFLQFEYTIDILLHKLYFFDSIYSAQNELKNGNILVNNIICYNNKILQKGDIITFNPLIKNRFNYENNIKKFSLTERILTFVEIDYYTKTIIIIKKNNEISSEDFYLLLNDF